MSNIDELEDNGMLILFRIWKYINDIKKEKIVALWRGIVLSSKRIIVVFFFINLVILLIFFVIICIYISLIFKI